MIHHDILCPSNKIRRLMDINDSVTRTEPPATASVVP